MGRIYFHCIKIKKNKKPEWEINFHQLKEGGNSCNQTGQEVKNGKGCHGNRGYQIGPQINAVGEIKWLE